MTLKVWILFVVPEMGAVNKMHATPQIAFLKVKEFGVLHCPYVAFPHGFRSSKQKYGDPAGGATSFGVAAGPQDHHFS